MLNISTEYGVEGSVKFYDTKFMCHENWSLFNSVCVTLELAGNW